MSWALLLARWSVEGRAMALRGWSWDAQWGPAGVGDRPLVEALEVALPDEAVEAAIEATGTRERRRRRLPTPLVVTLVVAMGLWASASMRHALAEVVAGWRAQPCSRRTRWELPSTAAIVHAGVPIATEHLFTPTTRPTWSLPASPVISPSGRRPPAGTP